MEWKEAKELLLKELYASHDSINRDLLALQSRREGLEVAIRIVDSKK